MSILLAFSPFLVFAIADRFVGTAYGLCGAAAVSLILIGREWISGRSPKILEVGSAILFGGLAVYELAADTPWSLLGARLIVDIGLLGIVLLSIAIRRPFTLQYAREQVPPAFWITPTFVRTNYVIALAWAAAFVVVVICDVLMLYVPTIPLKADIVVTILAIYAAVKFTADYPERASRNAATPGVES